MAQCQRREKGGTMGKRQEGKWGLTPSHPQLEFVSVVFPGEEGNEGAFYQFPTRWPLPF